MKLSQLAKEGFKNNTYDLTISDKLLFFTKLFPIKGKWKIIDINNDTVKLGKLTKKGKISNRAKKRVFDKNTIENCVRNYSELCNHTKRIIKEV